MPHLPYFFDMDNPIRRKLFGFSYSEKMANFEAFLWSFSSSAILKFRNVVGQNLKRVQFMEATLLVSKAKIQFFFLNFFPMKGTFWCERKNPNNVDFNL